MVFEIALQVSRVLIPTAQNEQVLCLKEDFLFQRHQWLYLRARTNKRVLY